VNIDRRELLLGAFSSALARPAPTRDSAPKRLRVGLVVEHQKESSDMAGIFQDLGIDCRVLTLEQAETVDAAECSLLWLTCPAYPSPMALSPKLSARVEMLLNAGTGVFAEFISNFPRVPAGRKIYKTGIARLFVSSPLDARLEGLPAGTILDEHDSVCLPLVTSSQGLRRLLSFGQVPGVERAVRVPPAEQTWPGLVWGEAGPGRFAVATTSVSDFRKREYAPLAHWERFLRALVLALLPESQQTAVLAAYIPCRVHTEPRNWVMPGAKYQLTVETRPDARVEMVSSPAAHFRQPLSGNFEADLVAGETTVAQHHGLIHAASSTRPFKLQTRVMDRQAAYRRALDRNIQWFEGSGVLVRPDGTLGVTEWISGPDMEGNRIPYGKGQMFSPERADCVFESGIAFRLYGKLTASRRHLQIGENLLTRILDFQRLDRDDSQYGLWYTRGRSGPPWEDDIGWTTIGCLAGYQLTGNEMFLDRGSLSVQASLLAVQRGGAGGLTPVGTDNDKEFHPHDRGHLLASWLYAYGVTGDRAYLDAALPPLRRMVERFPKIPRFLISKTAEAARFILPLALAYAYTADKFYWNALEQQAAYLRSRTSSCGAIQEDQSNTGDRLSGTDLGLTYDGTETISDQLYTTSFASMNFWIAYKATGDQAYLQDFFRLTDYLVRIQVESSKRETDGGWMRGFDYGLWEYYGSNADQSWTTYCLETGWTNAIIDVALSLYLLDEGLYPPRAVQPA